MIDPAPELPPSDMQAQLDALVVVRLWALLDSFEQRLSRELAPMGLTVASFRLIGELMRSPQGVGQSELARRLGIRPPSVSAAVSKLEHAGLVERAPHPSDARAYLVRLRPSTPLEHGAQILGSLEAELTAGLDAEQRERLVALLDHATHCFAKPESGSS